MPDITREQKHQAALREVRMRRNVYPRRVANGDMTQAEADEQIAVMLAIARDYEPENLFSRMED